MDPAQGCLWFFIMVGVVDTRIGQNTCLYSGLCKNPRHPWSNIPLWLLLMIIIAYKISLSLSSRSFLCFPPLSQSQSMYMRVFSLLFSSSSLPTQQKGLRVSRYLFALAFYTFKQEVQRKGRIWITTRRDLNNHWPFEKNVHFDWLDSKCVILLVELSYHDN